jgi:hypothetical protein
MNVETRNDMSIGRQLAGAIAGASKLAAYNCMHRA